MKLPITELMNDCCPEQVELQCEVCTEQIKDNVLAHIHAEQKPPRRFRLSVLLAAALVISLLAGTVAAAGSAIKNRIVADAHEADRVILYYGDDDTVTDTFVAEMPDAQFALTYEVNRPQYHSIDYKLNWLPYPAHDPWPKPIDTDGWLNNTTHAYIQNNGYYTIEGHPYRQTDEMLYQLRITGLTDGDTVYYYNGTPTVVKQDQWNGWTRIEFTIDYTDSATIPWGRPINYLILFDPETSVQVQIAGTMDFEIYEKIAENMEIRITDELHYIYTEEWQEYLENEGLRLPIEISGTAAFGDLGNG